MDGLITSRIRHRVLTQFVMNPGQWYYCRQVARICGFSVAGVQEELHHLEKEGYLVSDDKANRRYYRMNTTCDVYPELLHIIVKRRTIGPVLKGWLPRLGEVQHAFVFGSFASATPHMESDIDLLFVGDIERDKLMDFAIELETRLLRQVNCIAFSPAEFEQGQEDQDGFLATIMSQPRVMLLEA